MRRISVLLFAFLLILSCFGCSEAEPVTLETATHEATTFAESTIVEETTLTETKTSEETITADTPITNEVPTTTTAAPTTTTAGPVQRPVAPVTTTKAPVHTHSYSAATCTSASVCACGATGGTPLGHSYNTQGTCSRCGSVDEKYTLFIQEYNKIMGDYENEISPIIAKIKECESGIQSAESTIRDARAELSSLSPSCPQYLISQYVSNWQAYGSTWAATQAAQNAWAQQYNSKRNQLNSTISIKQSELSSLQNQLVFYNQALSKIQDQYANKLVHLYNTYGYPFPKD